MSKTDFASKDLKDRVKELEKGTNCKIYTRQLNKNDTYTFTLRPNVYLVAFNHPYGESPAALYIVAMGYTANSAGIYPILATNNVTITKPTNTSLKIDVIKSTFVSIYGL